MAPTLEHIVFARPAVAAWVASTPQHASQPVVYILDDSPRNHGNKPGDIYIGETCDIARRLQQDLLSTEKQHLTNVHVIIDHSFSTSVCIDLQAYLIRMFAGDGHWRILNRNVQVSQFDYPGRETYRSTFRGILDQLVDNGMFTRTKAHIEISNLYKLSPFKALTEDQATSIVDITSQLLAALATGSGSMHVLQGDPGTGKTVIATYLLKLLADVRDTTAIDDIDEDSVFYDFFTLQNKTILQGLRVGLVVPQQSLRKSLQDVFDKTVGLDKNMVITAFQVGKTDRPYDLLVVDETHRLNQRASQPAASLNLDFKNINIELFGHDDLTKTQLDWILAKSRCQLFLVDTAQGVLPADLPADVLDELIGRSQQSGHHFRLQTQMRVDAGADFIAYVRTILDPNVSGRRQHVRQDFPGYDFQLFERFRDMDMQIYARNTHDGLSRLVAGYAFEWKSKVDPTAYDIEIENIKMRWNRSVVDWVASSTSYQEVGSVHTIQGYDLNYVGVIIGPDLRYSLAKQRLRFDRGSYHDTRGKANNRMLNKTYSDEELLRLITQIYAILLTRGIRGTYVYVCDRELREYLKAYIPVHQPFRLDDATGGSAEH